MSELKAYTFSNTEGRGLAEYYLKSEADKEISRQKYKRCLAMAIRCGIGAQFEHDKVIRFDNQFYLKRAEMLEKWHKRWLKLAEMFK